RRPGVHDRRQDPLHAQTRQPQRREERVGQQQTGHHPERQEEEVDARVDRHHADEQGSHQEPPPLTGGRQPSSHSGTLGGFPSPPAKSSARRSRATLTRSIRTVGGFPSPPAKSSARRSRATLTRSIRTVGGF